MAPLCKTHRFLAALFLILAMWANQAASRKLQPTCLCARHEKWMKKFGKVYEDEEEKQRRLEIFKDNVGFIESFNAHGKKPYKLSINKFADLTNEEFRGLRNGYKRTNVSSSIKVTSFIYENTTKLPVSVDWRKKGAVTGIKNQEQCGSCWAFSAVAATEGITKLRTGKLISLSEQELIDCDKKDMGCQGGLMEDAFKFINKNRGITSEANYPYKGSAGRCSRGKENSHIAKITGYGLVPKNNEMALMKAVANQPVSVAIDASGIAFQFYSRGVFSGECSTELDHGVAVVGYGVTRGETKYWIVKNSWGKEWGESGYIRMKRGVSSKVGLCGIAMDPSFPIA